MLWPDNDYNKLEDNAVEFFNNCMQQEIKFMDTLNGVLRIDVANAPSFWFIMNSVDKRKPDNDFLCPRALWMKDQNLKTSSNRNSNKASNLIVAKKKKSSGWGALKSLFRNKKKKKK